MKSVSGASSAWLRASMAALLVVLGLVSSGCGSSRVDVTAPPSGVSKDARDFLLSPLSGYGLSVGADEALRLERAHAALVDRGAASEALEVARQLLARDPELVPARVLEQQVAFVARDTASVIRALTPIVDSAPGYTAARLLLARSAELAGRSALAFENYLAAADLDVARRRAEILAPTVIRSLESQLESSLAADDLEAAEATAARLEQFAPESPTAWDARKRVAQAKGNEILELAMRRKLSDTVPMNLSENRRLAYLETEVGDPTHGLELYERLATANPGDLALREEIAAAKFSWRLNMLPPKVADLRRAEVLSRGDFATLLYWVMPGVRSAAGRAQIATDIPLDHPQRQEVVRVLNLNLMTMTDPALRRFSPDAPIGLGEALDTLLRTPAELGVNTACAREYVQQPRKGLAGTCAAAVRCGIVATESECGARREVSGFEAREMLRRTLNLLGGTRPN